MGLGILVCAGGCYRDSDDFNAKAARYMCEYNEQAPADPFLDRTDPLTERNPGEQREFRPYGGPSCEQDVVDNLATCSASCDYSPRKARRCLRKLKRGLRSGTYNDSEYAVCERVYECPDEVGDQACAITTRGCAIGAPASPALATLFFVGLWVRRRRARA